MSKHNVTVIGAFFTGYIGVLFLIAVSWGVNLYKFTDCDFKSPVRCEVIHGVGIIPIVSVVTVWFDTDD